MPFEADTAGQRLTIPNYFLKLHLTVPNPVKIGKIRSFCISPIEKKPLVNDTNGFFILSILFEAEKPYRFI